jgi:hypothetical protein
VSSLGAPLLDEQAAPMSAIAAKAASHEYAWRLPGRLFLRGVLFGRPALVGVLAITLMCGGALGVRSRIRDFRRI